MSRGGGASVAVPWATGRSLSLGFAPSAGLFTVIVHSELEMDPPDPSLWVPRTQAQSHQERTLTGSRNWKQSWDSHSDSLAWAVGVPRSVPTAGYSEST